MESDFGPQPFIFCNNLADRKQRVAKSKGEEQGSRDEQTPDAGEGSAEGEGIEGKVEDKQGNPINADGSLVLESVNNVSDMTDNDFTNPTRNVKLPILPEKVSDAIGANGRPIVIKKNIFERNKKKHKDLTPEQSREILKSALYNPDLYGQNQKAKRPYNWIVINTKDENGRNRSVVIEISPDEMRDTALKELDAEQQLKSEEVTAATEKFLSADSEEERRAEEEARKAYEAKIADEDRQKRITVMPNTSQRTAAQRRRKSLLTARERLQ